MLLIVVMQLGASFLLNMRRLLSLLILFLSVAAVKAVPAYRGATQVLQPDGSYVTLRLHGDEWSNFYTTDDGYSLVKNQEGYYVYAQLKEGRLEATDHVAHDVALRTPLEKEWLAGFSKFQKPAISENKAQQKAKELNRRSATLAKQRAGRYDYTKFRGLVILVEYNDLSFSRDDYAQVADDMMNKAYYKGYDNSQYGKFTGSVRDYFVDNSMGLFEPHFDVVGPVRVDFSQYDPHQLENIDVINYEALKKIDKTVNFRQYDTDKDGMVDMIYFIYAGLGSNYGANDERLLWPHAGYITYGNQYVMLDGVNMGRYACSTELFGSEEMNMLDGIGTICHEFSHVLGLPDFYDTNYEKGGQSDTPDGWSLMASGCYKNYSRTPVGYSLFERYATGFATPKVITSEGTKRLDPLPLFNEGYRINTEVEKEYFLLENRQPSLFVWDEYLPSHGMLVYRVDSTNTMVWERNEINANPYHNYYQVIRAGGSNATAECDPFPGKNGVNVLDNDSKPASLLTWAGKKAQWGIYNIVEQGNVIRFEVRNSQSSDGISLPVKPKDEDASANQPAYNLHGQRVTKGYKGIVIRRGRKVRVNL